MKNIFYLHPLLTLLVFLPVTGKASYGEKAFLRPAMDSIITVDKLNFGIYTSIFNTGAIIPYKPQVSLGLDFNHYRHGFSLGIILGPELVLYSYSRNSFTPTEYLTFEPNPERFQLYGIVADYRFRFATDHKGFKYFLLSKVTQSSHEYIRDDGAYFNIMTKERIRLLLGFGFSHKIRSWLSFSFQIYYGRQYYYDSEHYENHITGEIFPTTNYRKSIRDGMLGLSLNYLVFNKK